MGNGRVNVVERADDAFGRRAAARADGRRAFGLPAPAALQFVESRVKLAPLAAGEEAPFEGVLQPVVVLTVFPAGDLGAGAANIEAVEDFVVPGAIVGPLANGRVEPPPVVRGDRLLPVVQVGEDRANAPGRAGVADQRKIWN